MVKKILSIASLVSEGAVVGFIIGAILGFFIGKGLDYLIKGDFNGWRSLYGGIIGAVTGLFTGAGTGGLGIRTRFGYEWILIIGIGIPLGVWLVGGNLEGDIVLLAGIGTVAGWLVTHFARFTFGKWLTRGTFDKKVIVIYFLIFGMVVVVSPIAFKLLASIFYF